MTGASPVVDTSTTQVGTNFTKELLTEIPERARHLGRHGAGARHPDDQRTTSAARAPARRPGSSPTASATRTRPSSKASTPPKAPAPTPATSTSAASRSSRSAAPASGADSFGGGANMSITVKSGGDRVHRQLVQRLGGRRDDQRQRAGRLPHRQRSRTRTASSSARRSPAATRSTSQYDINFNIGGPLWKQKAWFFYSYRLNDQYKYTLGIDDAGALEADQQLHLQGHLPAESQQPDDRLPEQAQQAAGAARLRPAGADLGRPLSGFAQLSRGSGEWTSVLGSRVFLDVHRRQLVQLLPAATRPTSTASSSDVVPGRIDTGTQPAHRLPRLLPGPEALQAAGLRRDVYFKDGWKGSHDFKFGYDWKRDRR